MAIILAPLETRATGLKEKKLLVSQHRGIVFAHSMALHHTLDLDGSFLHLLCGAIVANGEPKTRIYSCPFPRPHTRYVEPTNEEVRAYRPTNLFVNIHIPARADTSGEHIELRDQYAQIENEIYPISISGDTSKELAELFVTKPCDHHYYEEYLPEEYHFENISSVRQGLWLAGRQDERPSTEIWLQAVDQNTLGQWIAFQTFGGEDCLTILQRECCIACAIRLVEELLKAYGSNPYVSIRIIHGRYSEEEMDDGKVCQRPPSRHSG